MNYNGNDNLEVMKYAKNYNNFLINEVFNCIKKGSLNTVLDFGCADGFFIEAVKSRFPDIQIAGIEVDETSIKSCVEKNIKVHNSIDDVNNEIQLVYSFNVLEHIEDDADILRKISQKLIKNGYLILYVPALMFLYSSMDTKTGHFRRYHKKNLIKKLCDADFKIRKIEYCDSLGVLATLLYILKDKILKNNNGNISKSSIIAYDAIFPVSRFLDKLIFKNLCGKNLMVIAQK